MSRPLAAIRCLAIGLALQAALAACAMALEEHKDERAKIKACEASLCALVVKRTPRDGAFACKLSKTWAKNDIKKGSASGKIGWGFGDARCSVDLKLSRAQIVEVLTSPKATLYFPEHAVKCDVERDGSVTPVTLRLAPKVEFKNGRAAKAWINLKHVDGPATLKGLAFTVAKLEDRIGIFHKPLINALNKQLHEKCPKVASAR